MKIKRPLIWFLLFYLGGMGLYTIDPFLICFILVLMCFGLVFILYRLSKTNHLKFISSSFLLVLPIFFLFGYFIMGNGSLPHQMDSYFDDEVEGDIIGTITHVEDKDTYQLIIIEEAMIYLDTRDILQKDALSYKDKFYSEGLKIYNKSPINSKIGNTISLSGNIIKFQKATNPGQFDEYKYNKIQKYDYKVYCDFVEIINDNYSPYYNFLHDIKNKISDIYIKTLPSKNSGVLSAMVLGDKNTLDANIKDLYQTHGISHILAISGLHVSLIGMTIYKLLRKSSLNIPLATFFSIVLIYSYGSLTGFGVSTIRAVIMLILLLLSKVIGRTYDILSAASFSGLIILINNPLQVYSTGFLLSFGAILGIGLVYPTISSIFKIENRILKALLDSFIISLSVQIVTLPILLYFFFEISTYSILFNIILVPFVSIIIIIGIIGGSIGLIYLPVGSFFLGGTFYILNFYEWVLNIGNKFPHHTKILGRPGTGVIITYYLLLLIYVMLNYWKGNKDDNVCKGNNVCKPNHIYKYSHVLLVTLLIIFIPSGNPGLEVTFIDVGQGDGILIESSTRRSYLIDGGSSSVNEVGKYRIIPLLKSKGINKLDFVFISHFDKDHVSGIIEIMEEMDNKKGSGSISIKTLVLPKYINDNIRQENKEGYTDFRDSIVDKLEGINLTEDDMYKQVISIARDKDIDILYMQEEDYIIEGDMKITCLHPIDDFYYFNKNASSLVLEISYKEFDMLLTGDIEEEGEEILNNVLLERKNNIFDTIQPGTYDILKVAHHGSKNSTSNEFLSIVGPKHAVISSGKNNFYGHPHQDLLDRLQETNSKIYITANDGAIRVITDGKLMQIESFVGK